MIKNSLFFLLPLLIPLAMESQKIDSGKKAIGLNYGFGNEFRNTDYSYTNRYLKGQFYYTLMARKHYKLEFLLQPEINFATHQLLNPYFVTPNEPNYEEKRAEYTKLKDIHEYVLSLGLLYRRPVSEKFSVYVLISVGPMITDTETERLSKGFAFCDVLALGFSLKAGKVILDFRPNVRHISNAGLQHSNAGFNTYNFEFGVAFPF
jgi:hypothetical protein